MTAWKNHALWHALQAATDDATNELGIAPVAEQRLDDCLRSAIDPQRLLDNIAEAWRTSPEQARTFLERHGMKALLARIATSTAEAGGDEVRRAPWADRKSLQLAGGRIHVSTLNPALDEAAAAPASVLDGVDALLNAFLPNAADDPLGVLYRKAPGAYAEGFLRDAAPRIDTYIKQHFGEAEPKYLVNSGIGANEQFNYFVSALANSRPDRQCTWLLANSPKEIADLPDDVTLDNTLFMEFSRSGITEETVKLHELTPRDARRIVFANDGPLKALAERDGNLRLNLPSEVSGRYGRNKTPILLAPMYVVGLDVRQYWNRVEAACKSLDISKSESPAVILARYIRVQQLRRGVRHIYLGTNDDRLRASADEFCQFWNEGVNRGENDITMSRYLGLPRDSHMNLEAILGTSQSKLAIFLLRTGSIAPHRLLVEGAVAINPDHQGLTASEVDLILALANVKRCSEKMPTILIAVQQPDLVASAWLGQLWADTTLVYSRLIGVDPGSNPEVKAVRTRAAAWLADRSAAQTLLHPEERA